MAAISTCRELQHEVARRPNDPELRRIYPDPLEEVGHLTDSWLQPYLGDLTPEVLARLCAFRRPGRLVKEGLDWKALDEERREEVTVRVQEIFASEPQIQFILCGAMSVEAAGFVEMRPSPGLYRSLLSKRMTEGVPARMLLDNRTAAAAFAREAMTHASNQKSKAIGQHSQPRWDMG